ncbi:DegQ family serine endoprotease [uncultured Methylovirgula sp.]|uniref:DegQ family serine endoprotease n=1 Tax=uncultured Methylovirgula sp. TaxID=1285960 RepID=UPI00260D93B2|nr:DegQ family serine endoprotease [uncultured Methylovirgula sp.]
MKVLSRPLIVFALTFGAALAATPLAAEQTVPASAAEITLSFAPIVKKVAPAVVNVYASRTDTAPRNPLFDDPIFRHFFGDSQEERPGGPTAQSLGSGVLIDPSGLVVTNYHVISGMTDVKVALADRREMPAEIVLRDQRTDLAVLRLKGKGPFPFMEFDDSDKLQVGDLVLAIGDPFGVGQTVTQGIISALARTEEGISHYGFFIQTDAAINPGNSGGALVDMHGRLIGINSAIVSQTGSSVGIGFAIPSDMVKVIVATAKAGRSAVRRPYLGAGLQNISKDIADSLNLDRPVGTLVTDVTPKSPAEAAGLQHGDLIVAIDGQPTDDVEAFSYRFATVPLGSNAVFSVIRSGKPLELTVKAEAAPDLPRDPVKITGSSPFAGATVINISPAVAEEYSLESPNQGVVISDIDQDSRAAALNLQKGDVVIAVNNKKIETTHDLEKATLGDHYFWKISIGRGNQIITTVVGG